MTGKNRANSSRQTLAERVVSKEAVAEELWPGKHMEGKYCPVYDLDISDSVEACINKLADINIFITGKLRQKQRKKGLRSTFDRFNHEGNLAI